MPFNLNPVGCFLRVFFYQFVPLGPIAENKHLDSSSSQRLPLDVSWSVKICKQSEKGCERRNQIILCKLNKTLKSYLCYDFFCCLLTIIRFLELDYTFQGKYHFSVQGI